MVRTFLLTGRLFFGLISVFAILATVVSGQQRAPKEETLLNGLKVAIFTDRTAPNLTVRLRIHSGSAFDPQGKEGVMRMLSETAFPSDEAREYFRDDLGGSFELITNYDYIQFNITARNDAILDVLETLANSITTPQVSAESADAAEIRVRRELDGLRGSPAYLADQYAAERLFGTFPYGRSIFGTTESHGRIDFADLRFGYDRFFTADNAGLTLHGNLDANDAYRAVRRFFGSWLKSERRIPATFRQPDAPDSSLEVLNINSDAGAEVRHLIRGYSLASSDFPASEMLVHVLDRRLKTRVAQVSNAKAEVRNEAHLLPGSIVFAISGIAPEAKSKLYPGGESVDAKGLISSLLAEPISAAEFQAARTAVLARVNSYPADSAWLDAETYRLPAGDRKAKFESVTIADVQKLAATLRTRPTVNLWMVKGVGTK